VGSIFALVVLGLKISIGFPISPFITLASFIFATLHAGQREGWTKALGLVVIVLAIGLFFESIGVATGFIYGPYHYSDLMGPKFLGWFLSSSRWRGCL